MKKAIRINIFQLLSFTFFGFIFLHLSKIMLQIKNDGWYVGQANLYGDLVYHIGFINKFLESNKVIVSSPAYLSQKPNYPIFSDFITAQIARLTGVPYALFLTTFIGGIIVIYVSRIFILKFIKSEKVVFLSLLLFFFNGGLGFFHILDDFSRSNNTLINFFLHLPREYTDIKSEGYWWINSLLAYFLPQRAFLFAFPITLTVLLLLYVGQKKNITKYFVLAGILAGILPLIQAHSLFLLFIVCCFYGPGAIDLSKNKLKTFINWLIFASITGILAIFFINSISHISSATSFIRIDPGWTSEENIIIFWFKNLGLFGPILIISLFWFFKKSSKLFFLYIPFLIIFILSNIFIFQPWNFDNSKLLIYWYFISCTIVSYFLINQFFSQNYLKKIIGSLIVFVLILSGMLDIFRTFTPDSKYKIFSNSDLEIAQSVKNLTPKNAIFVTSQEHNHPIPALSGRTTLLGFVGWTWSHGLPFEKREQEVKTVYEGGQKAEQIISKYKINYVTVGPLEKHNFEVNETYYNNYPSIQLGRGWQLYDVSNLWSNNNR